MISFLNSHNFFLLEGEAIKHCSDSPPLESDPTPPPSFPIPHLLSLVLIFITAILKTSVVKILHHCKDVGQSSLHFRGIS